MVFNDWQIVETRIQEQQRNLSNFLEEYDMKDLPDGEPERKNLIVVEIGAGTVVPSIRARAERYGAMADGGLIRINPVQEECDVFQTTASSTVKENGYYPLVAKSDVALGAPMRSLASLDILNEVEDLWLA